MARSAAARAFEDLDGIVDAVDWLHFGDLRSVRVWAMDRVAAATVRRPVGQPRRDISRRYRHRIRPACRCAFAAPGGDVVVEARPPQPIIISRPSSIFYWAVTCRSRPLRGGGLTSDTLPDQGGAWQGGPRLWGLCMPACAPAAVTSASSAVRVVHVALTRPTTKHVRSAPKY
jgi:hypothetical protein